MSATRQPERRGFSLLVDGEVLACTQRREEGGVRRWVEGRGFQMKKVRGKMQFSHAVYSDLYRYCDQSVRCVFLFPYRC